MDRNQMPQQEHGILELERKANSPSLSECSAPTAEIVASARAAALCA